MSETVSFRLPSDEAQELDETADEKGVSKSTLARRRYRRGRDDEDTRESLERLERRLSRLEGRGPWWHRLLPFVVALVVGIAMGMGRERR